MISRDVIGGDNVQGDPNPRADAHRECRPSLGVVPRCRRGRERRHSEQFDKPIERARVRAAARGTVFYLNAEGADNYGVELSWKNMGFRRATESAHVFTNLTVMEKRSSSAKRRRARRTRIVMVGQARTSSTRV